MPSNPPLTSAGAREPDKRPRPIPRAVRDAITLMVYGQPDDPDCAPIDFIAAAALCGLKPDQMRRWLDRPQIRALLRAERRAFRDAICAGNESALRRVRDTSRNGMCTVAAVRCLEQLDAEEADAPLRPRQPGVVIVVNYPKAPADEPLVPPIDVTPAADADPSSIG